MEKINYTSTTLIHFCCLVFLIAHLKVKAQQDYFKLLNPPNVTEFSHLNYFPINESIGRVNLNIPIYTIDLDGLKIPISISYNTSGVKVNSSATTVGLNWSLNAGGIINKEIKGFHDVLARQAIKNGNKIYHEYGFLRKLLTFTNNIPADLPIENAYRDLLPDVYYAFAPGLSSKFIHLSDGNPLELEKKETIINSPFTDSEQLKDFIFRNTLKPGFHFKLTNSEGFKYTFADEELLFGSNRLYPYADEYGFQHYGHNGFDTEKATFLSLTTTENELENNSYAVNEPGLRLFADPFSTIHLSSIESPLSDSKVEFIYENNYIIDNDRRIERFFAIDESSDLLVHKNQVHFENDYTREKLISQINFPLGIVSFHYTDRLNQDGTPYRKDVRGGRILSKIEVHNYQGSFIKGFIFNHTYIEADDYDRTYPCSDTNPTCYRLILSSIDQVDANENILASYTFAYNPSQLPTRFSPSQDFSGYYNRGYNLVGKEFPEASVVPKLYFKSGQKEFSYIPFPHEGYSVLKGTMSVQSDLQYAKAGILEEVTFPTGSTLKLEYELNDFSFFGETKQGGGLRIKSQSFYDNNNQPEKKIHYEYTKGDGLSSGRLNKIPQYYQRNIRNKDFWQDDVIRQYVNSKLHLSETSYVTYSQVEITEQGNGYTINQYTNSDDFPDIPAQLFSVIPIDKEEVENSINDGLMPDYFTDNSLKRGKLISSVQFNNDGDSIKTIQNKYMSRIYGSYIAQEFRVTRPSLTNLDSYHTFHGPLVSEGNDLVSSTIIDHFQGVDIVRNINYSYYDGKSILHETQQNLSDDTTLKIKYYYPFDVEVSSKQNISSLNAKNRLIPVKKSTFRNDKLIDVLDTDFKEHLSYSLTDKISTENNKENSRRVMKKYHQYDVHGNPIEIREKEGTRTVLIWGYNGKLLIEKIENATYSEVESVVDIASIQSLSDADDDRTIDIINNGIVTYKGNEGALRKSLQKIRESMPESLVTSYTHDPLVGVTSITDPRGETIYYEYDEFKRLVSVQDAQGNLLSKNQYHYKNQ